jgi:hypothetical protein
MYIQKSSKLQDGLQRNRLQMQISTPLCQSKQVSHLLAVRKIIITKIFGSMHLLFNALKNSCTKSYMSARQLGLRRRCRNRHREQWSVILIASHIKLKMRDFVYALIMGSDTVILIIQCESHVTMARYLPNATYEEWIPDKKRSCAPC